VRSWLLDTNTLVYAINRQGDVRDRVNTAALKGHLLTSDFLAHPIPDLDIEDWSTPAKG
jgi:hypothetical protein